MWEVDILPPEIWMYIISFTVPPSTFNWEHQPFQSPQGELERQHERRAILSSVVLVCRAWRVFAEHMRFESVNLDSPAIVAALEADDKRAAYVRHAVISYQSTQTATFHPLAPAIVLKRLPNLQVLERLPPRSGDSLRYEFDAECASFPSLKRLDWWNMAPAAQSGGINSLPIVLQHAPHIQYLTVGGNYGHIDPRSITHFPELITLHLHRINVNFVHQIRLYWSMPALTHLIYTGIPNPFALTALLDKLGAQLRTLDFTRSLQFLNADYLLPALSGCPALHELSYFVNITLPPFYPIGGTHLGVINDSVCVVRLHGRLAFADAEVNWDHLERHILFLAGRALPSLKTVVLYPSHGIWDEITSHPRFVPLGQALEERGCGLKWADGEAVT